jgi:hypothetical protein
MELLSLFGVEWVMPRRVLDLLNSLGKSLGYGQAKAIWRQVPLCLMCGLWRERNAWNFEDVETSMLELQRNVLSTLYLWISAHHSPSCITFAKFLN